MKISKPEIELRIDSLDGLRGIAVLLVLLFHYINNPLGQSSSLGFTSKILMNLTYFGWVGVDLFFVLSGFLIGGILFRNRNSENYFKTFYIRRFLRIIPVYFLLLVIFYILNYLIGDPHYYLFEKPLPAWSYMLFIQNFMMGIHGHFGSEGLTPTWSLAIEEQFYLLCPLLIWWVNPKRVPVILMFFIIIAIISRLYSNNWYQSYVLFNSRLDSISIGVLLAYVFHFKYDAIKTISLNVLYLFVFFLFVVIITFELWLGNLGIFKHTVFALLFALLIIIPLLYPSSFWAKVLKTKLLIKLGLISYSLYLFHLLINGVFHQVILNNRIPVLNSKMDLLVSISALVVSISFSQLLYRLIEKPAMQYGKTFSY